MMKLFALESLRIAKYGYFSDLVILKYHFRQNADFSHCESLVLIFYLKMRLINACNQVMKTHWKTRHILFHSIPIIFVAYLHLDVHTRVLHLNLWKKEEEYEEIEKKMKKKITKAHSLLPMFEVQK